MRRMFHVTSRVSYLLFAFLHLSAEHPLVHSPDEIPRCPLPYHQYLQPILTTRSREKWETGLPCSYIPFAHFLAMTRPPYT